jgi:hypothetical protein
MQGENVRSMPAEHVFSKVEDRTTTRAVSRCPYALKPSPYSPQFYSYFHLNAIHLDQLSAPIMYGWLTGCVHGWPNEGRGGFDLSYIDVR